MRVLLDNNVNHKFARLIKDHQVTHAREIGWAELHNGDLIAAAEREGFEVLITADKSMQYQQNLADRKISVVVLHSFFLKWHFIEPLAPQVQSVLDSGTSQGSFITINPVDNP